MDSLVGALVVELEVKVGLVKLKPDKVEVLFQEVALLVSFMKYQFHLVHPHITVLSPTGVTFPVRCEHHRVDRTKVSLHLFPGKRD